MKSFKVVLQNQGASRAHAKDIHGEQSVAAALVELGANDLDAPDVLTFVEGSGEPIDVAHTVAEIAKYGDAHPGAGQQVVRLYRGRCRKVTVTVTFNNLTRTETFPPVTRVGRVHQWATIVAFKMSPRDAAEHVLELVGGDVRPDTDTQIGALTAPAACAVAFDLVPFKRVEG